MPSSQSRRASLACALRRCKATSPCSKLLCLRLEVSIVVNFAHGPIRSFPSQLFSIVYAQSPVYIFLQIRLKSARSHQMPWNTRAIWLQNLTDPYTRIGPTLSYRGKFQSTGRSCAALRRTNEVRSSIQQWSQALSPMRCSLILLD